MRREGGMRGSRSSFPVLCSVCRVHIVSPSSGRVIVLNRVTSSPAGEGSLSSSSWRRRFIEDHRALIAELCQLALMYKHLNANMC